MPKRTKQGHSQLRAIALGGGLGLFLLLGVSVLGGILIVSGAIPEGAARLLSAAAVLLAAFAGPLPIQPGSGKKPMAVALLYMLALLAVLFLGKLLFWPETMFGSWAVVGAALAGAVLAGLVRTRRPRRRR